MVKKTLLIVAFALMLFTFGCKKEEPKTPEIPQTPPSAPNMPE
ncbi:MAG: hypothetical protein ABFD79_09310 [Phycisphaerales bacterium]